MKKSEGVGGKGGTCTERHRFKRKDLKKEGWLEEIGKKPQVVQSRAYDDRIDVAFTVETGGGGGVPNTHWRKKIGGKKGGGEGLEVSQVRGKAKFALYGLGGGTLHWERTKKLAREHWTIQGKKEFSASAAEKEKENSERGKKGDALIMP